MSATPMTFEAEPTAWYLNADGSRITDEKEYRQAMNRWYSDQYGGLSAPLDGTEIFDIPQPEWVLENLIQEKGLTLLHAKQGSGKTFMALDWAFSLAHPEIDSWQGLRKTMTYRPMFIMTEGISYLPFRAKAWSIGREKNIPGPGVDHPEGVLFQRSVVRMERQGQDWAPQVAGLLKMYQEYGCNMLFVDTLANTFTGNENMQEDANRYLDAMRLFLEYGPVILVHHNTKGEDEYRGSSVLSGAADTMVLLKNNPKTGIIKLSVTKQKDGEPWGGLKLRLKGVGLGFKNKWQEEVRAPYFVSSGDPRDELNETNQRVLAYLEDSDQGMTVTAIAATLDLVRTTVGSALESMEGRFVRNEGTKNKGMWYPLAEEPEEM